MSGQKNGRLIVGIVGVGVVIAGIAAGALISYGTQKGDIKLGLDGNERSIENMVEIAGMKSELKSANGKLDWIVDKLTKD